MLRRTESKPSGKAAPQAQAERCRLLGFAYTEQAETTTHSKPDLAADDSKQTPVSRAECSADTSHVGITSTAYKALAYAIEAEQVGEHAHRGTQQAVQATQAKVG